MSNIIIINLLYVCHLQSSYKERNRFSRSLTVYTCGIHFVQYIKLVGYCTMTIIKKFIISLNKKCRQKIRK